MVNHELSKMILGKFPYKTELHCHSSNVSMCSDITPSELIFNYKVSGYSGIALTNHFYPNSTKARLGYKKYAEWFIDGYREVKEKGMAAGIKVYLGMEIRFEENMNDYLIYGISEDFVRFGVSPKVKTLREFVSQCKPEDSILIQAHPFRDSMRLMPTELLDGVEVYNMHPNHNSRNALAAQYALEFKEGIFTCGTDYHHAGQDSLSALLSEDIPDSESALVRTMRDNPIYKVGSSVITF